VPSGKSKLRAVNLSQSIGGIDIWRTQPDFHTPTKIQIPFPYLSTTAFVQSDSGFWEVFITRAGSTAQLTTTGQFRIEPTGKRTVIVLDSANTPILRVLPE
jgi:hypothetical protein